MSTPPPCSGRWDLFDSTDLRDHLVARALCATCPLIAACHQRLQQARDLHTGGGPEGPEGTWAGRLVGARKNAATKLRSRK